MRIRTGVTIMIACFLVGYLTIANKIGYPYHQIVALVFYGVAVSFFIWVCLIQWKILKRRNESLAKKILKLIPYYLVFKVLSIIAYTTWILTPIQDSMLLHLSDTDLNQSIQSDLLTIGDHQVQMKALVDSLSAISSSFDEGHFLPNEQTRMKDLWAQYLSLSTDLDYMENQYRSFYLIDYNTKPHLHADVFFVAMAAFALQYQNALLITGTIKEPAVSVLNASDNYGKESFYHLQQWVTQSDQFIQLSAGAAYLLMIQKDLSFDHSRQDRLNRTIQEIYRSLGKAPERFIHNPLDFFEHQVDKTWRPIQQALMVNVHAIDPQRSRQRICLDETLLEPGDVLLTRSNWQISSVGMPGFWRKAAIYLGQDEENHGLVITADLSGVEIKPLDEILICDYCAVLRPHISSDQKNEAIERAKAYCGLPYDYELDHTSDDALTSAEVVVKAYMNRAFDWHSQVFQGHVLITPNDIAQSVDMSWNNSDPTWELIVYLSEDVEKGQQREAMHSLFQKSWQRPKWSFLLNEETQDEAD